MPRHNNFDALRLLAALVVLVGHSWPLSGHGSAPTIAGVPVFTVAVWVFFSLSGFLVTTSWERDPSVGRFLARRAGRIFPALVVIVVVTVVAIGPAVSTMTHAGYWASPTTWIYLSNITLVASYELPGVFEGLPRPVVNGSLWTLGPEFCCYLVVMAVGLCARRLRPATKAVVYGGAGAVLATLSLLPLAALRPSAPSAHAAVFSWPVPRSRCGWAVGSCRSRRSLRCWVPGWLRAIFCLRREQPLRGSRYPSRYWLSVSVRIPWFAEARASATSHMGSTYGDSLFSSSSCGPCRLSP